MRSLTKRYPKVKDVDFMGRTLQLVPKDMPFKHGWRESEKGVPNYRFEAQTNERVWTVDVYAGDYFVVRVGDRLTEALTDHRSVLLYLYRMLGVGPEPAQPSNREPS